MTTNNELSKAIVSILTTNVPVIITNDLRLGLDQLDIQTGSFNRSLTRLKRMGLVKTFVANLPRLSGWTIPLTQAAISDAMITKVMTVSRASTSLPGEPTQFVMASPRLAGLFGNRTLKLADMEVLIRYLRIGKAFADPAIFSQRSEWRTAPQHKNKKVAIARMIDPSRRPLFFIAPPPMTRNATITWLQTLVTEEGQNVVC